MINGVPYPFSVKDETSLLAWIASIDREVDESTTAHPIKYGGQVTPPVTSIEYNSHREIYRAAYFKQDDIESEAFAKAIVCQHMAMELFSHLINAPKGKIVWRVRPEFDVSLDTIPADLSKFMNRGQIDAALGNVANGPISLDEAKVAIGKPDWGTDFTTDSIFPVAAPLGEWRLFKSYARYSVVIGNEVITPHGVAA